MTYRSIFLAPEWQHVAYHGWADSWPDPGLRIMRQRRGPVARVLAVNELADPAVLDRHAGALVANSPLAEVCFHDLTGSDAVAAWAARHGLAVLRPPARMLNLATFVIDLTQRDDDLLAAMSGDTRRKLRKGEATLTFLPAAHDDPALLSAFFAAFDMMARERGLQRLDPALVRRMIADRRARLFAVARDGVPQTFLLSYETGGTGFFASGAAVGRADDGAGQLLHWGAMRAFREAGLRWYDMGGIASTDADDGIHRFKKGFGGQFVDLGREYGRSGLAVRAIRAVRGRLA